MPSRSTPLRAESLMRRALGLGVLATALLCVPGCDKPRADVPGAPGEGGATPGADAGEPNSPPPPAPAPSDDGGEAPAGPELPTKIVQGDAPCEVDADCVPDACCHPAACVGVGDGPACGDTMCTMDCQAGTMDCGGGCLCQEGRCAARIVTSFAN